MRIGRKNFEGLVPSGADLAFRWPVAKDYRVLAGRIVSVTDEVTPTFPLSRHPDLFLSFARLGKDGEPSEERVLGWVRQHGLLRIERQISAEEPAKWDDYKKRHAVAPKPMKMEDFRTEVREAYQLLTLYAEVKERDVAAVMKRFIEPDALWPHTPQTPVDRDIEEYQCKAGAEYRALLKSAGWNEHASHIKHAIDILIRCVNHGLQDVRLLLEQNWWEVPPPGSASLGFERRWHCPDLLSAMYLQFYLLITERTPMRICANPNCRMLFPATRGNRRYCKGGCRSTGRNYR